MLGNEIDVLVNEEKPAGNHEVIFSAGGNLSSGIYFCSFVTENFSSVIKMVLIK